MKSLHEQLQNFWTPFTLRCAQFLLNLFRKYPLTTAEQAESFRPFFIIGSGRSGTTLLRAILSRHPDIAIPPENYGLINAIKKFIRYNGLDWQDIVNLVYGEFQSHEGFRYWETDLFKHVRRAYDCPKEEASLAFIIDCAYRAYMHEHKPDATIWGDKTPFNTLRLKWIHKTFPEARYIHLLRDGRDVVASYVKADLMPDIEAACDRWLRSIAAVHKFEKKIGANRVLTVRYENLVTATEDNVRHVCQFLNLEYTDKMLDNTQAYMGDDSLDHLANVRRPINPNSIGKWKRDLNTDEQRKTLGLLKGGLHKEGYITSDDGIASS